MRQRRKQVKCEAQEQNELAFIGVSSTPPLLRGLHKDKANGHGG